VYIRVVLQFNGHMWKKLFWFLMQSNFNSLWWHVLWLWWSRQKLVTLIVFKLLLYLNYSLIQLLIIDYILATRLNASSHFHDIYHKWSKMAINFGLHTYIVRNHKIPLFYFAAKRRRRTRFLTAETKFQLFNRSISSPGWETFLCSWSFLHIHIHT
jgi:hypothetical protein